MIKYTFNFVKFEPNLILILAVF